MNRYALYLILLMTISCISLAQAKEKDPLFIKQNTYDTWVLSEYFNAVTLTNAKGSPPLTIKILPVGYSTTIQLIFDKALPQSQAVIELDVGDFITELKPIKQSNTYSVTLEPMTSLSFFNNLKESQNIIVHPNDNDKITIPLKGVKKALDDMGDFAKAHYIILPLPFSQKIDVYSTMSIPDIFPFNLYPLVRQQSYYHDICNPKNKDEDQEISKQEACKQEALLVDILKQQNFCKKEKEQIAQSFLQGNEISYEWINCVEN